MSRRTAHALLCRSLVSGSPVAVRYLGADYLAHAHQGRVVAFDGNRFTLAFQDPTGLACRASFDLANPDDVLSVEPVR